MEFNKAKFNLLLSLVELRDRVKNNTILKIEDGICDNACKTRSLDELAILEKLFSKWPKFSGSTGFPVDNPYKNNLSKQKLYFSTTSKWTGRYGRLRIQLLNHCIRELKKEMS